MMIEALVSMSRYLSARHDDDLVDRMNYLYTPNALLVFSVLISFKQFGGRPLECMFPNKFPGSWEQYAENFCWSEDTYYLPPEVHVATVPEAERYSADRKLSYYQWVPFFLLLQAACFRLPSFLWKCFCMNSGICVDDLVTRAMDRGNVVDEVRRGVMETLAAHISRALRFQRAISRRNALLHRAMRFCNVACSTCFVSYAYLLTKVCYLLNVLAQLYLMNRFLETNKLEWYGLDVVRNLVNGVPWSASGYFPRVSLCDFTVRQVANIQRYTVQCVLLINIFNEKIFILLWFWYTLLTVLTIASLAYWTVIIMFRFFGRLFVERYLELNDVENFDASRNTKRVREFVDDYLKQDGVFLLRMIGLHAGILFTTELVMHLYQLYFGIHEKNRFSEKLNYVVGSALTDDVESNPSNAGNHHGHHHRHRNHYANNLLSAAATTESMRKRRALKANRANAADALAEAGIALMPSGDAHAGNARLSSSGSSSGSQSGDEAQRRRRGGGGGGSD